jgi:cytochrome c oxidase subunit 4
MSQTNEEEPHATHKVSYGRFLLIWAGLISLTGLTVAVAGMNLGHWIVVTSLSIAALKTTLVLNIFMHLKFEERVFRIFVLAALIILLIFFTLTFIDYGYYGS